MSLLHRAVAAALLLSLSPLLAAAPDETNMVEVQRGEGLALETYDYVDLSGGGAVEFWFRTQSDAEAQKTFVSRTFQTDAYSMLVSFGSGQQRSSGIVVGAGTSGPARLGIISDLSDVLDRETIARSTVSLIDVSGFGEVDDVALGKGRLYHVLLVQEEGAERTTVYFNGRNCGTVDGTLGARPGLPLYLGDPPDADAKSEEGQRMLFPFDGMIGGLRVWDSSDFGERTANQLLNFGRPSSAADLSRLPQFGSLLAYGDFVGAGWDPERRTMVKDGQPRLRFPDPLSGAWRARGATVRQTKDNASVFDDYAVFSFVPSADAALPKQLEDRTYQVFEDANYVGELSWNANGRPATWSFQHADEAWSPLSVEYVESGDGWVLRVDLGGMPRGATFGGARTGEVELRRRTVDDLRVPSLVSEQEMTEIERLERKAESDAMSLVFLYTAYPKYYDTLYSGYNIVKMDPWNLFKNGVKGGRRALAIPDGDHLYRLQKEDQLIMPFDLGVLQENLALENSSTRIMSSATDYAREAKMRIGSGLSGSVTVGAGGISPITASGTMNMSVVLQAELFREISGRESRSEERILRNKWQRKHTLYHEKDVTGLDPGYTNALRALHDEIVSSDLESRRAAVYRFFDDWGTHYPFAAVFGSLELSETKVDKELRKLASQNRRSLGITINGGDTSMVTTSKDGEEETRSLGTTQVRSFGGPADSVPIALDLRPLHELLTPQTFPHEPEIYLDLRYWLSTGLEAYRVDSISSVAQALPEEHKERAGEILEELSGEAPEPVETARLGFRYKGLGLLAYAPWLKLVKDDVDTVPIDGKIEIYPYVVEARFMPEGLRSKRNAFARRLPKKFTLVDNRRPEEQYRMIRLGTGEEIQPFGKAGELAVEFPVNDEMAPYLGLAIFSTLQVDKETLSAFSAERIPGTGATDTVWAKQCVGSTGGFFVTELSRMLYERTWGSPDTDPTAKRWFSKEPGQILWANGDPQSLSVTERFARLMNRDWQPEGSTKAVQPGLTGRYKTAADGRHERFVFREPQDGLWRAGKHGVDFLSTGSFDDPVAKTFSDGERIAYTLRATIHYEYALERSFGATVGPDMLGADDWGRVIKSDEEVEAELTSNRTTTKLRFPPRPARAAALAERLGLRPDEGAVPRALDAVLYYGGSSGRSAPLGQRGNDVAAWLDQAPGETPVEHTEWTLVERERGAWWLLVGGSGMALTADGDRVTISPARPGNKGQLWQPAVEDLHGLEFYRFRSAATGTFLTATLGGAVEKNKLDLQNYAAEVASIDGEGQRTQYFSLSPEPTRRLQPGSGLRIMDMAAAERASKELARLSESLSGPTPEIASTTFSSDLKSELLRIADADGDGSIAAAEWSDELRACFQSLQGEESAAPGSSVPDRVAARLTDFASQRSVLEAQSLLEASVRSARQVRVGLAATKLVSALDANADGRLTGNESAALASLLQGMAPDRALSAATLDLNRSGDVSAFEVARISAALARPKAKPAQDLNASAAFGAAVAALREPLPTYGEEGFMEAFKEDMKLSLDANGSGSVEPAETPDGDTFDEHFARTSRRIQQLVDSQGARTVAAIAKQNVEQMRAERLRRTLLRFGGELDVDKSKTLDPLEARPLLAALQEIEGLESLQLGDLVSPGGNKNQLRPEDIYLSLLSRVQPKEAVQAEPAAEAPLPKAPEDPAQIQERVARLIKDRMSAYAARLRGQGLTEDEILKSLGPDLQPLFQELDLDGSKTLETSECAGLLTYLGVAASTKESTFTPEEFTRFVASYQP